MTANAAPAAKTVVVADDTAFVRDRFQAALEGAGHRVLTACTAAELLQRVRAELDHIDLVLVDLRLPNAKGLEIIRSIRAIDGGKLALLVFSGTLSSAEEVRALASLGIAGFINEYLTGHHIIPALAPHLQPGTANRRISPRVVLGVPISYRFGSTIAAALTLNLGRGGVAVRTTSPLDAGTTVRARFRLRGAKNGIDAQATVAWTHHRVGMGLQFTTVSPDDQRAIDDFVDRHFFTNRKA